MGWAGGSEAGKRETGLGCGAGECGQEGRATGRPRSREHHPRFTSLAIGTWFV